MASFRQQIHQKHQNWLAMVTKGEVTSHSAYLFINQDARSLALHKDDPKANQSKQKHVQRLQSAKRKAASVEAYQAGVLSGSLVSIKAVSQSASVRSLQSPSVPRPRQGFSLDPFGSTTLTLHPSAARLVQYYRTSMIPSIFPADAITTSVAGTRHLLAFQKDMRDCINDEAHMYALLASSSAHVRRFEGQLRFPAITEDATTYFKFRAITAMRAKLSAPTTDRSLFQIIYRLMATERCLGNSAAAMIHSKALYATVEAFGGLNLLDQYNKERIIHSDLFAAFQALDEPHLPLTWDPIDVPTPSLLEKLRDISLIRLGVDFEDEKISKLLHLDIKMLLSSLADVVRLTVYSWHHEDLTSDDLSWLTLRRAAIDHRLLSFPSTHTRPADHNFFQEAVRLATIFWLNTAIHDPVRVKLIVPFVPNLRRTLERSGLQSLWYPHTALLLWVATTGAFIADTESERDWFGTIVAKTATYLSSAGVSAQDRKPNVDSVKDDLEGFLYLDEIQHEQLAELVVRFEDLIQKSPTVARCYDLGKVDK